MSLFRVFDISGSALSAQTVRMNTTASNMANADAISSSVDETYRARQTVFATEFKNALKHPEHAGVNVVGIVESDAPLRREYRPNHPYADDEGYVTKPNVNPVEEMANMISASRSFQSSLEAINVSKQLILQTLRMGE